MGKLWSLYFLCLYIPYILIPNFLGKYLYTYSCIYMIQIIMKTWILTLQDHWHEDILSFHVNVWKTYNIQTQLYHCKTLSFGMKWSEYNVLYVNESGSDHFKLARCPLESFSWDMYLSHILSTSDSWVM